MGETGSGSRAAHQGEYVAVIDQERVTDEVRDIALKYDPLNQRGRHDGFHVTDEGELHIDEAKVMAAHKLIQQKIPNDAIRIIKLPAERGQLVHQYGENAFRLYELPAPVEGSVVGVLGANGLGKSTALRILAGRLPPNLGDYEREVDWDRMVRAFRGTAAQRYLEQLRDGLVRAVYKPQRTDRLRDRYHGTVGELVAERDDRGVGSEVVSRLDLDEVLDRRVDAVSGGELQRTAIAAAVVADADTYVIDEPSSFLDIEQRSTIARLLGELAEHAHVVVVDHDLISLDLMADTVHIVYGDPGGFGVVSRPVSIRRGINQFLAGDLPGENLRFRDTRVEFLRPQRDQQGTNGEVLFDFPALAKSFPGFSLRVEPGVLYEHEIIGVFGRNGLGKTTFARLLTAALKPDNDPLNDTITVSYKPQYLEPPSTGTVRELFESEVDVYRREFETQIQAPFDLEPLYPREVRELSGGELQRVSVALALARQADLYVLDEPSAYLDVEHRTALATHLRAFTGQADHACLVIDHDLLFLDYASDRTMVFEGTPAHHGVGRAPEPVEDGINRFLRHVDVTIRRDPNSGRPRVNKPDSRKDREQKRTGTYYAS